MSAHLRLIARLKDGMTHERAQARLDQITASNVAAAIFSRYSKPRYWKNCS